MTDEKTITGGAAPVIPLSYSGGGARWNWAGRHLHVFVPADRHAHRAHRMLLVGDFIVTTSYPLWRSWYPVVRGLFTLASRDVLLLAVSKAIAITALLAAIVGIVRWWLGRLMLSPTVIIAGPDGCRYGSADPLTPTEFLPADRITHVICTRLRLSDAAVLRVAGKFGHLRRLTEHRRLAVGAWSDLNGVAEELRVAVGLTPAPTDAKNADARPRAASV